MPRDSDDRRPKVDSAIEAVKLGALDYLSKPLDLHRLSKLLHTVRHDIELRRRLLAAESELATHLEFLGMIGRSPAPSGLSSEILVRATPLNGATGSRAGTTAGATSGGPCR